MQKLSKLLTNVFSELGGDPALFSAISKNNAAYKNAVEKIWQDKQTSEFILKHTNAVYVRRDERPKKGPDKDKDHYIAEIVIDDGLIRSEIDTHREMLYLHMLGEGIAFDEIKIIPAKGNMRRRHPFG